MGDSAMATADPQRSVHLGRVLVVDDDPGMRRACTRLLGAEGWTVVAAEHGRAAVDAMKSARDEFDCVLSDVNMPELDGFGLVAAIRQYDDDLPVLLMTGDPSLDGAVRAIDSGAVSYLAKPFDQETLAAAVARAARRHGVRRMRRRAEAFARELDAENAEIATRFSRALERAWMAFQPIVDLSARRVYAYEALIRTDEESLKRPDVLIATAERLGRIHDLGRTVRHAVARAAAAAPPDVLLFVNVHGLELADEQLYAEANPLAPLASRVVLEITERVGLDPIGGPTQINMLRRLGFQIAVDDLGAGYAALGALASLEPEVVKLDMSLIRDLGRHARKRRVVGAIATLVRELGGTVVAEGVETEAERDAVLDCGITLMQGWLFARPARELVVPKL
ncbi:MAG TPA: EAL domain-containing protein [Kofleriaceae bacterium]|nr:EAL domain-containing protein [Kofleriaceae bacterium]